MAEQVSGWLMLTARRFQSRRAHKGEDLWTAKDVASAVRRVRKQYLGSDISLEALVVDKEGLPDDSAVNELTEYLCKQAVIYRRVEHLPDARDVYDAFFYYSLYMFAFQSFGDESVDDLIQLGDCYEKNPLVFSILGEDNLSPELSHDLSCWVMEQKSVPVCFSAGVLAAVSALLGVLPDYNGEIKWMEDE